MKREPVIHKTFRRGAFKNYISISALCSRRRTPFRAPRLSTPHNATKLAANEPKKAYQSQERRDQKKRSLLFEFSLRWKISNSKCLPLQNGSVMGSLGQGKIHSQYVIYIFFVLPNSKAESTVLYNEKTRFQYFKSSPPQKKQALNLLSLIFSNKHIHQDTDVKK